MATLQVSGVQYSGIWTMQQVNSAISAGTWPTQPAPHLYAWGLNSNGQLGLGNTTNYSSPKQVDTLTSWSVLPTGTSIGASLVIKTDGTLWAWGYGPGGRLGLGNTTSYSSPKQVGALTNWSKISVGYFNVLTTKTDGTLWAWGGNGFGQLGLGNITYYSSPKQIGSLTTWLTTAAGAYSSYAIKTDGTLWSWARNDYGELGLNNTTSYSSPKQVGSLTTWSKITAGFFHALAIKTDGTIWSWGWNSNYQGAGGQLGLGNSTNYSSPKQIGALTTWLITNAGPYTSLATKTDGTLWSWGINSIGELGLGNRTNYSSPKQIGVLTNWLTIASGRYFTVSTKTDGTLWTWGQNNYGQLGTGNTTNYSSPKQVGSLTTWSSVSCSLNNVVAIAST